MVTLTRSDERIRWEDDCDISFEKFRNIRRAIMPAGSKSTIVRIHRGRGKQETRLTSSAFHGVRKRRMRKLQ